MKKQHITSLISVLSVILAALIIIAVVMSCQPEISPDANPDTSSEATQNSTSATELTQPVTDPPVTNPPITEPPVTQPPATEPPATEPPATQPSSDSSEMIGTLYTRGQLEALSNESFGYGPGPVRNHSRAEYAVAEQTKYSKYAANFIGPDNNCIYLTFDCGYEYTAKNADGSTYRVTEKILDVMKEKQVKGVFFVTMDYVKSQPDLVQRMIDEGHVVGNHSKTHPAAGMPSCSLDKMIDEVMSLHNYVLEKFGYKMTLFRPPTGSFSIRSLAVVQTLGYKTVHWSFAYQDWYTDKQPNVASSLQNVKDKAHSGAIYLLHAVSTTNASLLGDAIDYFRAEGYTLEAFQ